MKNNEIKFVVKTLLDIYSENHYVNIVDKDFLGKVNDSDTLKDVIYLLQAKSYLSINITMGNTLSSITLNPSCISYFYDKKQETKALISNWTMNISIAIASAVFGAILARLSIILFP